MTATRTRVDKALEQAVEEAFEDAECCWAGCTTLATAVATCLPCGHQGRYCTPHRRYVQRTRAFHVKAAQPKPCGTCGVLVEAVAWGRA